MPFVRRILPLLVLIFLAACSQPEPAATEQGNPVAVPASPDTTLQREQLVELLGALDALAQQQDSLRSRLAAMVASDSTIREAGDNNPAQAIRRLGFKTFFALLVLIGTSFLVRGVIFLLENRSKKNAKRRFFYKRLVPIARIVVWIASIVFIVRTIFEVDAQGFFAAAAAIGVAVGFAAQDILKNIFGGIVIVFDQPFQVGDKISVGGTYGEVTSIGLRSTRIVTPDDNLVSVPNAQIVDGQVSNANAGEPNCQVVTDIYLPGWVNEAKAKKIAYQAAASSRFVYLRKPIVVLVKDEFKETFLTRIRVKAYVLEIGYEFKLMSDVTERARAEFRRQGLITPTYGTPESPHPNEPDTEHPATHGEGSYNPLDA